MIPISIRTSVRHPGETLREEFLPRLREELSQGEIADRLGISRPRLNELLNGARSVTPDTALRLARAFGTTAEFWLEAQARWDLQQAQRDRKLNRQLNQIPLIADPPGAATQERKPPEAAPQPLQMHPTSLIRAAVRNIPEGEETVRLFREFLQRRGLRAEAERYVRIRAQVNALNTGTKRLSTSNRRLEEFLPIDALIRSS